VKLKINISLHNLKRFHYNKYFLKEKKNISITYETYSLNYSIGFNLKKFQNYMRMMFSGIGS